MLKKKVGTIVVPPGAFIDRHEKLAADYVAVMLGYDVTFLVPDRRKGAKTPDVEMNGLKWEIKSPHGKSTRTIENVVRQALKQSPNIILDLRRMDGRIPTKRFLDRVTLEFQIVKLIKRMIVITREEKHIDFER